MSSKLLTRTAILCTAILTASCGSSGGGTTPPDTTPPDTTPSTVDKTGSALADGYLAFATVCLDTTEDKSCADEDSSLKATTDTNGSFTLSALAAQYAQFAVVLEAEAGTAKEGGSDIPSKIVLSAPIGETDVVSPLTTLAESYLQANASLSSSDAEDKLLEDLEITDSSVSIYDDYIALLAAASSAETPVASAAVAVGVIKDDYTLLKQVAQVASLSLQQNIKAVDDAVQAGTSPNLANVRRSLIAVIGNDVLAQIADIASKARAAGINFTPANVVRLLNIADIETAVVEQNATANATAVSVQDNLTDGVSFFGFEDAVSGKDSFPFMEQQRFTLVTPAATGVEKKKKTTSRYNLELGQFGGVSNNNGSVPANGTWQTRSSIDITFNADGSAIVNTLGRSLRQQSITTDVSGLKLKTFVSPGMKAYVKPNDTFSSGAKAIRPTFRFLTDYYIINPNNTTNISTFPRNVNNGIVSTAVTAATLNDLLTPTSSAFDFANQIALNDDTNLANDVSPKAAFFDNINPRIKFTVELIGDTGATSGTAEFYEYNFADRTQSNYHLITHIATGTWQRRSISLGNVTGGNEQFTDIITTEVPAIIRQQVASREFEKLKRVRIFTELNGSVRRGRFVPQGVITTKQNWRFNSIATANIVANVNATVGNLNGFFPVTNLATLNKGDAFNLQLHVDTTETVPQGTTTFNLLSDFGSQPFIRADNFVDTNIAGNGFVLTTSSFRSVRDIYTFNVDGSGSIVFSDGSTPGVISLWTVNAAGQLTYTEAAGTDTYNYVATPIVPTRLGDNAIIEISSSILQGTAGFESVLIPVRIEKSQAVVTP